ncbi:beta-amylase [Trifolium repens]|nr:beta-amylase [Trifolium repens]
MQILRNFRDIFKTFYLCYHYSKGVQIGKSPSGELKYPSLSSQKLNLAWSCELGEFQWCDKDVDEKQSIWKAVWKIKAPHSVKNFLWRVARNILPTRGRLSKKVLLLKIGALLRLAC